jgi:hypothetical protein
MMNGERKPGFRQLTYLSDTYFVRPYSSNICEIFCTFALSMK